MDITEHCSDSRPPTIAEVRRCVVLAKEEAGTFRAPWLPADPGGWAMSSDALRFLAVLVRHLQPRHILEFGSGVSTIVIGRACEQWSDSARISSIEHDPEFHQEMQRRLDTEGKPGRVALQLAPIVARECVGRPMPMYHVNPNLLASAESPDLVVVDGPPAALGGREGVLYQALDLTRSGTLVLLDDANRPQEQALVESWRDNLGDAVDVVPHPEFAKGLASIIIRRPVPRNRLWEHRLMLSIQDIIRVIPTNASFILIDDDQWNLQQMRDRRFIRIMDRDGRYDGPPAGGREAVAVLERLRGAGASHIVVGWPSFWWLNSYPELRALLEERYLCVLRSERLLIFDLKKKEN